MRCQVEITFDAAGASEKPGPAAQTLRGRRRLRRNHHRFRSWTRLSVGYDPPKSERGAKLISHYLRSAKARNPNEVPNLDFQCPQLATSVSVFGMWSLVTSFEFRIS